MTEFCFKEVRNRSGDSGGGGWGLLSIYLKQDEFLSKELSHLDVLKRLKEVKKTNPYGYLHNKSK